MNKYYFDISGISMNLDTDDEANDMCYTIQSILQKIGIKEADVLYSTEEDYNKERM